MDKNYFRLAMWLLAVLFGGLFFKGHDVSAANWASIKSKAAYEGVYFCFTRGAYAQKWKISDEWSGLIANEMSGGAVKLPYELTDATDNNTNNSTDCKQILYGFSAGISDDELNRGLIGNNFFANNGPTPASQFFESLGYNAQGVGDKIDTKEGGQIKIRVDLKNVVSNQGLQMATTKQSRGTSWNIDDIELVLAGEDSEWQPISDQTIVFPISAPVGNQYSFVDDGNNVNVPKPLGTSGDYIYRVTSDSQSPTYFIISFDSSFNPNVYHIIALGGPSTTIEPGDRDDEEINLYGLTLKKSFKEVGSGSSSGSAYSDYIMTRSLNRNDYMPFLKGLNDNNNNPSGYKVNGLKQYSDLALSDQEVFDLYTYYIHDVYKAKVICNDDPGYDSYTSLPTIHWKSNAECKISTEEADKSINNKNIYGVDDKNHFTRKITLDDIIKKLNSLDVNKLDTSSAATVTDDVIDDTSDAEKLCKENAGALGWLLCPIIVGISDIGKNAYDFIEENFLQLQLDKLFSSDSGLENAWRIFRDIANAVFIILFLVVIFSQLTGVGIDNYGIKKIMPKIIVTAILVNLSFIICELAADLSNILGAGLENLLSGLAPEVNPTSIEGVDSGTWSAAGNSLALLGFAGGGAILFAILAPGLAISAGVGLGLAVLGILISLIAAVFFLFITLMVRNAGVVILIAISPVAFVCNILPNTEKLFKKWLDLFKSLLLLYPICGLMVGGGVLAGHILASINSAPMIIAGMVVEVLPFFLVPSLTKQSLRAMGNIGARLSGAGRALGRRASGGTQRAIKNSDRVKTKMQDVKMNSLRRRMGIDAKTGLLTDKGAKKYEKAANKGGARLRLASARLAAINKWRGQGESDAAEYSRTMAAVGIGESEELADGELGNGFNARTEGAFYGKQLLDAARQGDTSGMNAAIEAMSKSNMKSKDITKLLRYANDKGFFDNMDANTRSDWMRNLYQKHGNILASDFEFSHFARAGGSIRDAHGNTIDRLGGYGEYAKNVPINIEEITPEDVLKLSGDSMAGLISAGTLDASMAKRVMAMNPNISADKRIMLGATADGIVRSGVDAKKLKDSSETMARGKAENKIDPTTGDPVPGEYVFMQKDPNDANSKDITISQKQVNTWTAPTAQSVEFGEGTMARSTMEHIEASAAGTKDNTAATAAATATTAANTGTMASDTTAMRGDVRQIRSDTGSIKDSSERDAANGELTVEHVKNIDQNLARHTQQNDQHHQQETDILLSDSSVAVEDLSDEALGELATNPKYPDSSPRVQAAQKEWDRREQNGKLKL